MRSDSYEFATENVTSCITDICVIVVGFTNVITTGYVTLSITIMIEYVYVGSLKSTTYYITYAITGVVIFVLYLYIGGTIVVTVVALSITVMIVLMVCEHCAFVFAHEFHCTRGLALAEIISMSSTTRGITNRVTITAVGMLYCASVLT